mgnify:CR=1 FL=1
MSNTIYTLTSELHDERVVSEMTKAFLGELGIGDTYSGKATMAEHYEFDTHVEPGIGVGIREGA